MKKQKACIICGNLFDAGQEYICSRCKQSTASPEPSTPKKKTEHKRRILVIDDEPMIVKMLQSRLVANGYEVLTAYDGEQGFQMIKAEKPDLVISDIIMPKVSGYNLVELIAAETDGTEKTPVIIMTARGSMKELFHVWNYAHFIEKPFEPEDLMTKVREVFKQMEEDGEG
ncbi:MAG: response regulator [Candidatus Omnitrophota bacterium]|nr:response regulator [Candidatus Omnitrophota bacterium]